MLGCIARGVKFPCNSGGIVLVLDAHVRRSTPGTLWGCTAGNTCVSNLEEPINLRKVASLSILVS